MKSVCQEVNGVFSVVCSTNLAIMLLTIRVLRLVNSDWSQFKWALIHLLLVNLSHSVCKGWIEKGSFLLWTSHLWVCGSCWHLSRSLCSKFVYHFALTFVKLSTEYSVSQLCCFVKLVMASSVIIDLAISCFRSVNHMLRFQPLSFSVM